MILQKITNLVNYFKALHFLNLDIYDNGGFNKNLKQI
jgi:hypothetical protein